MIARSATLKMAVVASGDGLADTRNLAQVQQIVACVQPTEVLQGLFPALHVYPHPSQISGRGALNQPQVRPPKRRKQLDRLSRVRLLEVQPLRPYRLTPHDLDKAGRLRFRSSAASNVPEALDRPSLLCYIS